MFCRQLRCTIKHRISNKNTFYRSSYCHTTPVEWPLLQYNLGKPAPLSRHQEGKTKNILDVMKHFDRVTVTSAGPYANYSSQKTAPAPHHSTFFFRPNALMSTQQSQSTKGIDEALKAGTKTQYTLKSCHNEKPEQLKLLKLNLTYRN